MVDQAVYGCKCPEPVDHGEAGWAHEWLESCPIHGASVGVVQRNADQETLELIAAEVVRARTKFPGNKHLTVALMEEVGELAQAILQDKPKQILKEAVQVAAVAVRIIEEGDAAFDVKDWSTKA